MAIVALDTEYAWCAGFFDGEGNVGYRYSNDGVRPYRSPALVLQIAQTDLEVLERFKKAMGVGTIIGPYSHKTENSSDYWVYRANAYSDIQHVILSMWPYLGSVKKLDTLRHVQSYLNDRQFCPKGHNKQGMKRCSKCASDSAYKRWSK